MPSGKSRLEKSRLEKFEPRTPIWKNGVAVFWCVHIPIWKNRVLLRRSQANLTLVSPTIYQVD
jgi:hypothetical protein